MKKVVLLLLTSCSGKEIITTDSIYAFGTTGKVDEACQIMKETITSKEDRDVVAKIEFRDAQKRKQEEVEKAYSKKVYE